MWQCHFKSKQNILAFHALLALDAMDRTDAVTNASYPIELCHGKAYELFVPARVPDATKLKRSIPEAILDAAGITCVYVLGWNYCKET